MILRPTSTRHAFIPPGWTEDEDLWLYRDSSPSDAANLIRCNRAFQVCGRTFVADVWEAEMLDKEVDRAARTSRG